MNTITQIENALKAINQASFETLVYHLLHFQGNKFIAAPGAVVGKEKTSKGSPDSFFVNDSKYIFVECTTQHKLGESKSFFEKLVKDIDHCFKQQTTKIDKEKIEKIILACNEKISTEEYEQLVNKVKSYNHQTDFEIFTIQNLPLLIFDIPKLAEEYLNIQIVKGDIYTLEQFLLKTEKGLQPSLTNEFIGRVDEIKNCLESLDKYDILLLSGGAGVGKSKLAVKILEMLSLNKYIPIVIQSSGVSLWDDYQHLFLPQKQHIILFDDANKSITNLNYLLSKLEESKSYSAKIIITSRDYVKKQVSATLDNYSYKEFIVPEFKDEEIGKIIESALPNLKYHYDIKRKIVDLAKGNARIALMATYSVTTDSETNYLNSPVLLYEKYFKKISDEIGIFNNPIILKSVAIVSFFGVLDRNNDELKNTLSNKFSIDWNELWTAIMELHNGEILNVYFNEIVKVTDQVLATYAFYKCFIDKKSAVVNYAEWIDVFIEKFSSRISATLIDINNTFAYQHVKDLVLPHLNILARHKKSEKDIYAFYSLFWFYKGRDCLLYLKKWINSLPKEQHPTLFKFTFVHNKHTKPSKYSELLFNFWNHSNELLKPSIELTLELLDKQPSRLSEVLKFIDESFKFKLDDSEHDYLRQNILLDILTDSKLNENRKILADGIFLNIAEVLLGWHYTQFASSKGNSFSIYNFDLYKSDELIKLRERILKQVYHLFDSENEQLQKILRKIIYPGGDIDKSIYVDELPIYQRLIFEKLDKTQYAHCKFVCVIAKHLTEAGIVYPENWNEFIDSDIRKLSKFLKPDWEYNHSKSIEESEKVKQKEIDDFVKLNEWKKIEQFLFDVSSFYKQQKDDGWHIQSAITNTYISIAKKDIAEFVSALKLFFNGQVNFPLRATVINVVVIDNIMTADEFLNLINAHEFPEKLYWKSVLVAILPEAQLTKSFLTLLIDTFQIDDENIYINRMLDYLKYQTLFNQYQKENPELEGHNIITYLTSLTLLKKRKTRRDFGLNFFSDCSPYFLRNLTLLKSTYRAHYEIDSNFDHNGEELKAILDLDKNFISEGIQSGWIGLEYSSNLRLENINTSILWEYDDYEELIENLLLTIIEKKQYDFVTEGNIYALFRFRNANENKTEKAKLLISKLTQKHADNEKIALILIEVVYHCFNSWFIEYFKEFLLINKDFNLTTKIYFGRGESWSGSRVPSIQKKIEFYQDILKMINTLPDILEYSNHIDYFEKKIEYKLKQIEEEQKKDFKEEFF